MVSKITEFLYLKLFNGFVSNPNYFFLQKILRNLLFLKNIYVNVLYQQSFHIILTLILITIKSFISVVLLHIYHLYNSYNR